MTALNSRRAKLKGKGLKGGVSKGSNRNCHTHGCFRSGTTAVWFLDHVWQKEIYCDSCAKEMRELYNSLIGGESLDVAA